MNIDDYVNPVVAAVRSQFLTARAAARHMVPHGSGVILMFGGRGGRDPIRDFYTGGHQIFMGATGVAFGALDVMRRQLAVELGPSGIRVLTIESAGIPETVDEDWREMMTAGLAAGTMLKRAETLADVGDVAVFAASDRARSLTGTAINMTAGKVAD
jgi:3-oxoacyl-[acyl-carrier protein] reductase